jgi:hypothetical protein
LQSSRCLLLTIVTAGISKGGEVAVWLALSGTIPACGFIAIAPGGQRIDEPDRLVPSVEASRERGLRGCPIVGDRDTSCYEPTLRLAAFLEEQNIPYELEIHPGTEHWFPPILSKACIVLWNSSLGKLARPGWSRSGRSRRFSIAPRALRSLGWGRWIRPPFSPSATAWWPGKKPHRGSVNGNSRRCPKSRWRFGRNPTVFHLVAAA